MSKKLIKKVLLLLVISFIISSFPAPSSEAIPVTRKGSVLISNKDHQKTKKRLNMSQLIRKYPETIKTRGPRVKSIALTFDDVPDPRFTPQLLDVLRRYHVKATFFVVGSRAKKHPGLVARIVREGHAIGNHSYNHPQFRKLRLKGFRNQIIRTENIIQNLAGYKPKLIRPPYGEITEEQVKWAKSKGYLLINWNVDSHDWKGLSREEVRNNILSSVSKGAIILQHGGGGEGSHLEGSIQALPEVITYLKQRGYTFVTVPQLLHVPKNIVNKKKRLAVINGSLCFRSSDTPYRFQVPVSRRNISKEY